MVRLVCERGMQLEMRHCDCNGSAACTFWSAVIAVCLARFAMLAVRSLVLTECVSFDCLLGLL